MTGLIIILLGACVALGIVAVYYMREAERARDATLSIRLRDALDRLKVEDSCQFSELRRNIQEAKLRARPFNLRQVDVEREIETAEWLVGGVKK